ncbi:zinc finger and BTB domain-containing protein 21 [Gadus chalcogrammus]|uniref:zinc finger and BTB domain-containing protein 21 n=1 Tax=Gadus chalcogrammus TaxID=1042646 RepID=UPI0024C30D69|nr:zinc finger and BTB domain-containing protein 21 [Gadus chalcogrammus]
METLVHYNNPFHGPSVLGVLNEQRLSGQMCDTVLVVGDQRYQAHRSVLAASSEYFQSLFTRTEADAPKVVHLDFCEADAFEIVLNYMYSSSLFVDKGSLAAIQELGYSLGIPFLTNIVSTRPHVSYCVSRKRLSFSEEDETDSQTRSVIVCRTRSDRKATQRPPLPRSSQQEAPQPPTHHNPQPVNSKAIGTSDDAERKPVFPYSSILKGNPSLSTMIRPQLTSSVSFSDVEVQHIRSQPGCEMGIKDEDPVYHGRSAYQGQPGEHSQTIDRSGPLIKSLLRRSLSMDSPVPVFSPTLELHGREQSVVKLVSKATGTDTSVLNGSSKTSSSPLVLRTKYPSVYDEHATQVDEGVCVKAEPGSPLGDPLEIIRITIGDTLPVNLKHFQPNIEQGPRTGFDNFAKRKGRADNRRYPFKKTRGLNEHYPSENIAVADDIMAEGMAPSNPSLDRNDNDVVNDNVSEPRQGKLFKCWNCLKVFRSKAGLHRHVNMYHNPEKPYACEICHKRFHTNFKVWTHCQTQHGVVQNPASSSSSSMLDEKFQKRLIDMVREREIKKALLWKLKRNKQSLQSPKLTKNRPRTKFTCPYCGKVFLFQSQYKQHLRTHPDENDEGNASSNRDLYQEQDAPVPEKADHLPANVYACRLCNVKLSSLSEQGDHERGCRHATVCPYCGLRFSSTAVKKEHEAHCKYKKLTCLECMRTFKSSFSIWRHQVEVHNQNMMTVKDQLNLKPQDAEGDEDEEGPDVLGHGQYGHDHMPTGSSGEDVDYGRHSSGPPVYDSEDSSSYVPEDLSMGPHGKLVVKEEPMEEAVCEREIMDADDDNNGATEEAGVWPCEKCGNLFSSHKDLERHQELLCHIKPFICHLCNKAFRTNFRLWSHFQSHMSTGDDAGAKEVDRRPSSPSPSPPLTPQTTSEHPGPAAVAAKPAQTVPVAAAIAEAPSSPEPGSSSECKGKNPEMERQQGSPSPLSRSNSVEQSSGTQDPDTLFYHAPTLSALTFKRQYMCKLCHRTFKTAFSLWSHEQSHGHL